jgi:uncharacterized protein (UPF0264 family)
MTRLLVSVRSGEEAMDALAGGAAIIDVKEPQRGALGCADAGVLRQVAHCVGHRALLSGALGELANPPPPSTLAVLHRFRFAKIGLAGAALDRQWPARWKELAARLPARIELVAVAYADWESCEAPPPEDVLSNAARIGCRALLIDTHGKNGRSTLDWMRPEELQSLFARARSQRMTTVLAGSLGLSDLSQIITLRPDYLGVRGAVCQSGREGRLQSQRVAQLVQALDGAAKLISLPAAVG